MASGTGLVFFVMGLFIALDVGGMQNEEQPEMMGVVLAAIGAAIILASAWVAHHRPDDTPWVPPRDDLFGG